jgi:hypothetical protein
MRNLLLTVLVVSVLVMLACSGASSPPFNPVYDVKELMNSVLDPAADVIWGAAGSIITAQGTEELGPKNDEEWVVVRNNAVLVAESGNLLMIGNRPKDDEEWMRLCQALIEVGTRTVKAAEAKDRDAIFTVGGEVYAVCVNCHQKYVPEMRDGLPR